MRAYVCKEIGSTHEFGCVAIANTEGEAISEIKKSLTEKQADAGDDDIKLKEIDITHPNVIIFDLISAEL